MTDHNRELLIECKDALDQIRTWVATPAGKLYLEALLSRINARLNTIDREQEDDFYPPAVVNVANSTGISRKIVKAMFDEGWLWRTVKYGISGWIHSTDVAHNPADPQSVTHEAAYIQHVIAKRSGKQDDEKRYATITMHINAETKFEYWMCNVCGAHVANKGLHDRYHILAGVV